MQQKLAIVPLSEMQNGQEADLFALLAAKEELTTRDGKPYFRVAFRDALPRGELSHLDRFPLGRRLPRQLGSRATFYKLRATYRDTNYGPQLEIRKIRAVVEADAAGRLRSRTCASRGRGSMPREMFDELLSIARERIADEELRGAGGRYPRGRTASRCSDAAGRHAQPSRLSSAACWSTC